MSIGRRLRWWHLFAAIMLLLPPPDLEAASGDTVPSITVGSETVVEGIFHLYGASLGENWNGMDGRMAPDYVATSPLQRLDRTLPVYIDWEISTYIMPGGCAPCEAPNPTRVSPPRSLANEPWFIGHANEFGQQIVQNIEVDGDYTTCAAGQGLEEPLTSPLTADGRMRVADIHGGISDDTAIYWVRYQCMGTFCEYWAFVVRWNRVQTYTDLDIQARRDPLPGATVTQRNQIQFPRFCGTACTIDNIWSETFITQWVSSDASQTSPRVVNASDLAALSAHLNQPFKWGYDPPLGEGPASRNYHVNFAPFNDDIGSDDISAFAADNGKSCGLAKATAEAERDALMSWFGFDRSGRQVEVVPGEPPVPEWVLVDAEQNHRAILDPEGYTSQISAHAEVPWCRVKSLSR